MGGAYFGAVAFAQYSPGGVVPPVVPDPNFIRFSDEAYAAPAVTGQAYEGDAEDE